MSRIEVDQTWYEVREAGRGPAVLLLHGFTGRASDWQPFIPAITRAGYRSLVVDLLGHGRSEDPDDPARHAVERQAEAYSVILRGLGAAPAVVVGYSLGARIALRIAVAAPDTVAGLVLESPSAGIADPEARAERRAADDVLATRLEHDGIEAFLRAWEAAPLFAGEHRLPQAQRDRIHASRSHNSVEGLAGSLRGAGQGAMEPLHDRLSSIEAPTLVVAGALDPVGLERARLVAAGLPDARLVVLPDRGHALHRESPATFRALLIDQLTAWRPA